MQPMKTLRTTLTRLWHIDRPLTAVGVLMVAALAASLIAMAVDPRTITGVPAWLKPAKFAVSTAIYSFTLVWVLSFLPDWPKVRRVASWTTATVFVLEVVIIDVQAWRGTTSHFNLATAFDATLFTVMGSAIVIQTLVSVAVAVALWRHRFADAALGWALRLGMTLTIVGASLGGLMTRPTEAQLADARIAHQITIAGGHTVGAPDGGPGLPGTGWSREHGDVRVPHFIGLHALQVLPLVAFVVARLRITGARRVRVVLSAAGSYATLFMILSWQALRGQSLIQPDATTITVVMIWIGATALAAYLGARATPGDPRRGNGEWANA